MSAGFAFFSRKVVDMSTQEALTSARRREIGFSDGQGEADMRVWRILLGAVLIALAVGVAPASAQDSKRVLLYTGTTGFRHSDAINNGRPVVQAALEAVDYTV